MTNNTLLLAAAALAIAAVASRPKRSTKKRPQIPIGGWTAAPPRAVPASPTPTRTNPPAPRRANP